MKKKLSLFLILISVGLLTALAAGPVFGGNHGEEGEGKVIPGQFIVLVAGGHDPAQVASDNGVEARHTYRAALNGFAGAASPQQLDKLRKDERVLAVEQDRLHRLLDAPTGVNRAEADKNTNATDDGSDNIDVDVAVIDTGIAAHDDLDLRGGRNFAGGPSSKWPDKNGHGTHVAGSVGGIGGTGKVMGVAPGPTSGRCGSATASALQAT